MTYSSGPEPFASGQPPVSSQPYGQPPASGPPPVSSQPYGQPPASGPPPVGGLGPAPGMDSHGRVRRSRVSALWFGLIVAAVLLILLVIFIAQNSGNVTVHYLGLRGNISLALALLLSAIVAVLLVAIPGTVRILQLHRALKKNATPLPKR